MKKGEEDDGKQRRRFRVECGVCIIRCHSMFPLTIFMLTDRLFRRGELP